MKTLYKFKLLLGGALIYVYIFGYEHLNSFQSDTLTILRIANTKFTLKPDNPENALISLANFAGL